MRCPTWVTATDIDEWAKTIGARALLPQLICRLVLATMEQEELRDVSFPAHEEVQRRGYDGTTLSIVATAFVPQGRAVWELSCDGDPALKAEGDYAKRLEMAAGQDLSETAYVAVTARD